MASYIKKKITCMCCSKKHEVNLLKGYLVEDVVDLDTNPHNPALYDRVILCPNCGYATAEPYTAIDDTVRVLVEGDNYKEILSKHQYDDTSKKLLLAGYLSVKKRNAKEAGYNYLLAYWYLKEKHSNDAHKACEKAIKNFERYLISNEDLNIAMIVIDCLRQMQRFDDALETANSLESYIHDNPKIKSILVYEKKLIINKDADTHRMSEVAL